MIRLLQYLLIIFFSLIHFYPTMMNKFKTVISCGNSLLLIVHCLIFCMFSNFFLFLSLLNFQHYRYRHCIRSCTSWYHSAWSGILSLWILMHLSAVLDYFLQSQWLSAVGRLLWFLQIRDLNIAKRAQDIGFFAGFVGEYLLPHYLTKIDMIALRDDEKNQHNCHWDCALITCFIIYFFEGSAFMLGRSLTSIFWGMVADRYGRKPVIMISLFAM